MTTTVRAEPLTREAFAPFGDVLAVGAGPGKAANQGTATRYDWAARLTSTRPDARPNLAIFRSEARTLPFTVKLLERHPCSSQAFLPLACARYLVVVAPALADGAPDTASLRAFLCTQGQAINYHCGVWHHPIIALDTPADLAMLAWEDTTDADCVEHSLAAPLLVTV